MAEKRARSFYDYTLIFVVLVLCAFGLIMLYSTTSYSDSLKFSGDSFRSVRHQVLVLGGGVLLMLIVSKINYHAFVKWAILAFAVALALTILVRFIGRESHGERRWIYIGPISIQPAEVMKIGLILFYAAVINYLLPFMRRPLRQGWRAWAVLIVILGAAVGPVIISNLSSGLIIGLIGVIMLFVATKRKWPLVVLIILGVAALVAMYRTGLMDRLLKDYQMDRIRAWLDPTSDPEGNGYQILQSLYAVGSGGLFGKGLGQSIQKLGYLPEAQNDMIFSIICEELGIFGGLLVLGLFGVLVSRMVMIANNAPDVSGLLVVTGVLAHIGVQVIFNLCVSMNLMPNTGVSLPFISSGGSSLLCLMIEIGLVLNVSDQIRLET